MASAITCTGKELEVGLPAGAIQESPAAIGPFPVLVVSSTIRLSPAARTKSLSPFSMNELASALWILAQTNEGPVMLPLS